MERASELLTASQSSEIRRGLEKRNGHEPVADAHQRNGRTRFYRWLASSLLLIAVITLGGALAAWKTRAMKASGAAAAILPEPEELVVTVAARERRHRPATTAIGTVVALRSITLRNELPGAVRELTLTPGQIVEPGTILVALDTSVEEAELKAHEAQAALAETLVARTERAVQSRAASRMDLDRARAELNVTRAQVERIKAVIARKTIRAPFRARIGISDVHPGQYLEAGTLLTTLQGVDPRAHVDFSVPQHVARELREGGTVEIMAGMGDAPVAARIIALDARFDPVTRNATVRALVEDARTVPAPGASVRVRVPVGEPIAGVSIPLSALRKAPAGDHVFVVAPGEDGHPRARVRRVQTGAAVGDEVLILSGLAPGELVAASGSFKLRERVLVAAAKGNPAGAID